MAMDLENILTADQSAELIALSNEWASTPPGDRFFVEGRIRGKIFSFLNQAQGEVADEFVENLLRTGTPDTSVITKNYKQGVGNKIERLSLKTDGGLSRAAFHIAFADSLEDIREIVMAMDDEPTEEWGPPTRVQRDWVVAPTKEMEEWASIYDMTWLPYGDLDEFAKERGWTLDEPVHRLAYKKFGSYGNGMIVAVQDAMGIGFYVYKDCNPETGCGEGVDSEIYYRAPDILASM